ncbi:MAG TPA: hypothetical protein VFV94_07360 [Polyangiaceae bacterium]|nr:hypothetical protein [Polyangiaceae bacterium]
MPPAEEWMEIKLIIDDRIVRALRRVLGRPVLATAAGVLTLVGGGGVVYAIGTLNTFAAGKTISAAEVNANFTALHDAVDALEKKASPIAGCTFTLGDSCTGGSPCTATCPPNQVVVSGGCDLASDGTPACSKTALRTS